MSISAAMVMQLRERTGAGMMECKKALVETNGDIELAIEHLRKRSHPRARQGHKARPSRVSERRRVNTEAAGALREVMSINCCH